MTRDEKARKALLEDAKKKLEKFEHVYPELTRHGKLRIRAWKKINGKSGPKYVFNSKPGTPDFHVEYAAWISGMPLRSALPPKPTLTPARNAAQPKTWRWLCEEFFKSDDFRGNSLSYKNARRSILEYTWAEPIEEGSEHTFEHCPVQLFRTKAVRRLQSLKIRWKDDPKTGEEVMTNREAANSRVKAIRNVLTWAMKEHQELVEHNWARDVPLYPPRGDGIHCWTIEEIEQFRQTFAKGTKARLAMEALYYTGQRRGDLVRLGRAVELRGKPGWLRFVQEKNSNTAKARTVTIPVHPKLRDIIAATPGADGLFWLVQDNGAPYTKESFGNMFRDWCDEAGLPQCSAHGLRKACVVRMISDPEERATPHEVMSITGHTTLKEIDRYAREFMREQAAEAVLDRWLAQHRAA